MFGYTLITGTTSKRRNKYAQLFATNFGWTREFLMKSNSKYHEALYLIVQRDGVPPRIIVDLSKEQV